MSKNLDKLKQFFRQNKASGSQERVHVLTTELERDLRKDNSLEKRLRLIKDLGEIVLVNRLEEFAVQKLWSLTNDMLENKDLYVREAAFSFYTKLIQGQYRDLAIMRAHFFKLVQNHKIPVDLHSCLQMLKTLTENGRDIQNFEEEIGSFMLGWMDQIIEAQLTASYLDLFVNIIKYNTAYIDREIIIKVVQRVCNDICFQFLDDRETFLQCLNVIETVICYSVFPNEILSACIIVLCRAVNFEMYVEPSYKIMRNLLGTQLGYASLLIMCNMLKEKAYFSDAYLLRGAVFHTNMNLWGGNNSSLQNGVKYSSVVLSSYCEVLGSRSIIVTYEVILSLQTLIVKCGTNLSEPSWDIIIETINRILDYIDQEKIADNHDIRIRLHTVFDSLESLIIHNESNVNVNIDKVYAVIERISYKRPESSVLNLLNHKAYKLNTMSTGWIKNLNNFMERFYRNETNQTIRLATIEHLKEFITLNRACYEEEILEKVVIVVFSDIAQESDVKIRVAVCKLLLEICSHCDTKRCLELLDVLEKVMNHPFDVFSLNNIALKSEHDFEDSIVVVNGMIDLFLEKLHQLPTNHAIKIYYILITHLETHYHQPKVFENATKIRYSIINWMLRVRANSSFHIGYPSPRLISDNIKYSHYLAIEGEFQHQPMPLPQTPNIEIQSITEEKPEPCFNFNLTTLSIKRGCKIIVKCLDQEKDWHTVQLVLRELPKIMQNKTLIQGNDVDILAKTLIELFRISYTKEKLMERFTALNEQKDFRSLVMPAIASLITYNAFLAPTTKKKIVEILKSEVRMDGCLSICVQAFTILLMERCDIFERQLADIVLAISKVSDTMHVAIPILEFISTITHLPYSFTNLNQKQFSYVFATCLPYTSPARYDHYVVSLAHHIIASWFLKSRLQWRKQYADYIIEGIAKNIDKSMQDAKQLQRQVQDDANKGFNLVNEDSSLRKRSSSLTEQSNRRKEINNPQLMKMKAQRVALQNLSPNFDMHGFHIELIETCIDFMARHTYSLSLALPRRLPSANYLLRGGGQSKTWILGHVVITVTTNACMDNHDYARCSCYYSDWAEIIVRRPTGMLSWMMKFQNQVGAFANEFSFYDLKGLFSDYELDCDNPNGILVRKKIDESYSDEAALLMEKLSINDEFGKIPLQSTASDSSVLNIVTQPINIPITKPSELEQGVPEDDISYDDDDPDDPKRNPVRRVNSSPEMRSNWKHSKQTQARNEKDSKLGSNSTITDEQEDKSVIECSEVQQKKKLSYSKETKVSCEAIPEEISTIGQKEETLTVEKKPIQLLTSISAQESSNVTSVPKKQHSADDTIQLRRSDTISSATVAQANIKNQDWASTSSSSNLPLSPRYKASVSRQVSHQVPLESGDDGGYRARSKTISVIGRNKELFENQSKPASDFSTSTSSIEQSQPIATATSGINPSFVFVQLFNTGKIDSGGDKPLPVSEKHMGTLNLLDLIPPYEIHKIGVIYVKPGQANSETEILRNTNGSLRYMQFLQNLGTLIAIKDAKEKKLFVNMEPKREGNYTYVWHDDIIQMTFHVATLMPTLESDPNCNEKKKYIGNDFATIVYNESGEDYNLNTIKGQFNYACIVVQPLEMGSNLISIRAKGDIEEYFKHHEPKVISDRGAPLLARQLALHANMASLVSTSLKNPKIPYANNWLERLRKIKLLKTRIAKELDQPIQTTTASSISTTAFLKDVFTKYT
ncbi:hypothetical protein PVAND_009371 [Polypedilum vanderplanki]|uniref:Rap-GAP domain-containing protein n=1 Tax=Polypedilum vanderplanki TaxID=319348 RepID=A0A9J6CCE1_POLVA|nr:hypothetical protein PVAND_009371 [Polypedilum vanderplanki]